MLDTEEWEQNSGGVYISDTSSVWKICGKHRECDIASDESGDAVMAGKLTTRAHSLAF